MSIDYRKIGPHLRDLRKQRGLSITQASERSSVLPFNLAAIEKGSKQPSVWQITALAKAYGVRLEIGFGACDASSQREPMDNEPA